MKTREKLIAEARSLFVRKGVENTTMLDIAAASEKGRRTIYTYFRSKKEIYNAVLEQESEMMVAQLKEICESDAAPIQKLAVLRPTTRLLRSRMSKAFSSSTSGVCTAYAAWFMKRPV